jgi:hypothetical protein
LAWYASVAHRAARQLRRAIPVIAATAVAATATATIAAPAQAAYAPRVVIVVGPVASSTSDYLSHARAYARQARAYGASVTEIYTPHATWPRVLAAAQGANIFIYLGHGNGWPSPYGPWQTRTKDGLGLNPYDGSGNVAVKYYGEDALQRSIRLAPGAVVLLNRLCYASGSAEPGMAQPSWTTAVKRVDNYESGFMRTGASVVLADGHTSLAYELAVLFSRNLTAYDAWSRDPDANGHTRSFASRRNLNVRLYLDPDRANTGFYRSLAVRPGATTGAIRIAAYSAVPRSGLALRAGPSSTATILGPAPKGQRVFVRGPLHSDGAGRTWTPVMTRGGRAGWVAGWAVAYAGSARTGPKLVLRGSPSVHGARRGAVAAGARVTIVGSGRDGADRAWLKVVTPRGATGWVAAWLTTP